MNMEPREVSTTGTEPGSSNRTNAVKNWCFTLNNYTDEDIAQLKRFFETMCVYGIFETEVGEQGTPHIQGVFQLKQKRRLNPVIACMHVHHPPHLEIMQGGIRQAAAYCRKDFDKPGYEGVMHEYGTQVVAGKQTSTCLPEALELHPNLNEFMDAEPELYCRFRNGLRDIYARRATDVDKPVPQVFWFYGETGTGKSRQAHALMDTYEPHDRWTAPISLDWFDGYCGQKCVLFDDFRKEYIRAKYGFAGLLRLLDRYPLNVNIRNSNPVPWVPEVIIITCNKDPTGCFAWTDNSGETHEREDIGQLIRRIQHKGRIVHFSTRTDYE